ncbi:PREDICTED: uncharacterized protein LOC109158072 [Ipomoea nil]|uniref:uncharacterized protein LOC109158072 n=1 Tax=Ipomoea nil TaxID=35883 RepID=UPI000901FBF2|nr:PREDICTED: uncharacterized protein LOC109158072 [Ipomoea nil]
MAKAYDRMEWLFLEGMLRALGFDRSWVELLMVCVTSVKYSIMVNGEIAGQAEARGDIHGVRVARGAPAISHLFFADDSLLFFRPCEREAKHIKECLESYSSASGQLINFEKSSAVYSHNTSPPVRALVSEIIGVPEATDLGRYLGLPSVVGRNKTAVFRCVEENIRARTGTWQNKLLSRAGKEVLLKSIAQSLPIFTMSTFLLPMRVCDSLEKMFNRYWWGGGRWGYR